MKFVKKFETERAFNNFKLNDTNTPNISLIEELYTTGGIKYTQHISHDYSEDYFSIKALQNCSISIDLIAGNEPDSDLGETLEFGTLYYSLDNGKTWSEGYGEIENLNIPAGNKVLFKGSMQTGIYESGQPVKSKGQWITSTGNYEVEGNIMSLFYGDNFENISYIDEDHILYDFFKNDTHLINAQNLILPATTLCEGCYSGMFMNCTSLLTAPKLPAVNLETSCYADMFKGCTSLTTAPELLAPTLVYYCYSGMFNGCSSLNYIKCLAEYGISIYNTEYWVQGVANSGTFVCDVNGWSDWDTGIHGAPSNWDYEFVGEKNSGGGDETSQDESSSAESSSAESSSQT